MKKVFKLPAVGLAAVGILLTILLKLATKSLMLIVGCFLMDVSYVNRACSSSTVLNPSSNVVLNVFQSVIEPSSK